MVVITLTICPENIKGDLTRWLMEIDTGVYCGNISARVRDSLWDRIVKNIGQGRAVMVYSAKNEQHMQFRTYNSERVPIDYDGIQLIRHTKMKKAEDHKRMDCIHDAKNDISIDILPKVEAVHTMSHEELKDNYIVLDIETTGLDYMNDKILELGAVRVENGRIVDTIQFLISQDGQIPKLIVELTGISNELLEQNGRLLAECLPLFLNFIKGENVVCHNADFDLKFIKTASEEYGLNFEIAKVIDTLQMSRKKITGIKNYKIRTLMEYFNISRIQTHRALEDCYITWEIYEKLKKI